MQPKQSIQRLAGATAVLLLSVTFPALAQNVGMVSGTVHYADTGKAAQGVPIGLSAVSEPSLIHPDPTTGEYTLREEDADPKRPSTKVGVDGTFQLDDVAPGVYLVHTYSPPYLSPDNTIFPTSNSEHIVTGPQPSRDALKVEVRAGKMTNHIDLKLERGGVIEGSVLNEPQVGSTASEVASGGLPVEAELKLGPNRYAHSGGSAHADDKGHYRLEGLAPGDYIVLAGPALLMIPTPDGGLAGSSGLPFYAPATQRPSQASVVHIEHSEVHHLDLAFPQAKALHRIGGTIAISEDKPLSSALVRLYPTGEGGLTAVTPVSVGRSFSFQDVTDGDYTVSLEFPVTQTLVSVDAVKGTMRMRMQESIYNTTIQDVHVAGSDLNGVILRPTRSSLEKNRR